MYAEALARVRDVLAFYATRPDFLPRSLELEDCTRAAAKAAHRSGVPASAVAVDLRQLAADALPSVPEAAVAAGRAMARWAADEYETVAADSDGRSAAEA